jgi:hypothetical protein
MLELHAMAAAIITLREICTNRSSFHFFESVSWAYLWRLHLDQIAGTEGEISHL